LFLSDRDIRQALADGELLIGPANPSHASIGPKIQPSSVELHLGSEFLAYGYTPDLSSIDPENPPKMVKQGLDMNGYWRLPPMSFALAHTVEMVQVSPSLAAQVDGKSSLARLGLAVHMTSGFIDPGFMGQITLELFNAAPRPIILRPGMVIAQMFVWRLSSPAIRPYGSKGIDSRYQGQTGATPSRYGDRVPLAQVALNPHVVEPPEYPAESLEWPENRGSQAWRDTASRRREPVLLPQCCANSTEDGMHFGPHIPLED
jgi:dCTP deaminase